MSVLSDKEITALCVDPTHEIRYGEETPIPVYNHGEMESYSLNGKLSQIYIPGTTFPWSGNRENLRKPMIEPFSPKLSEEGKISCGLSSYGYDATLAPKFKLALDYRKTVSESQVCWTQEYLDKTLTIDPKKDNSHLFEEFEGDSFVIPPHGFVLGYTNEYFRIPKDVLAICLGKSTYARVGIHVLVTPLEPGWEGQVVIEITNNTGLPAKIYANEGICQFVFLRGDVPCDIPYSTRGGKYMHQTGITHAIVK